MVNKEYEKYFGYSIDETPTIEDWMIKLYPDADERNRVWKEILNEVKSFEVFRENVIEYEITTKYNGKKNVRAHYTLTEDEVICTLIDQTERLKKRQEIIESIITTEKKEKERIGRELHDGLGPLLTTAKIYVHSLNDEKEVNEEYLSRLNQLLNDALHELRMLINNESPHILKQYGLEKAIQTFLQNINSVSGIKVHLESSALEFNKEIIEFTLYRAILELINNTLKYSKASQISISIKQIDDNVTVTYLDNGIGFDYFEGIKKGNGLNNIHNRIDNVGGKVIFETEPGRGVKVVIQMNVNKDL
ncbi:sensor histidine kinase [Carboxylicivirga caseinilyticus]|uniref:sensor histidine kinase n=1 Tax=Carboxylicivirga caseinilyticus TaxID=3417572 RepID=UPI003D34FB94|nr:hypothetical protein [Marinilabiliaceae bacterium A049]